jgi:hypothetical protein
LLLILGEAHRGGRRTPLGTLAAFSSRVSGLPLWAALPLAITAISLVGALFGYMWDVSLHIDKGRDEGPFANPSHYFILAGLYGIIAAGYLSTVFVRRGEVPGRSAIRVGREQYWPLGGVMIAAAGMFAFAGFPLDDLWHRLFGQDVTLWGPTHLVMLSGGLLTLVGVAILFQEGVAVAGERRAKSAAGNGKGARSRRGLRVWLGELRASVGKLRAGRKPLAVLADLIPSVPLWPTRALIAGGFLAGLSIYQGEFDYGVPQFELVLQPLMIAGSAALALVCARIWVGPGGALAAVGFYLVIRGAIWLIVGPILGETGPSMPLYLPEAICVELLALLLARRPVLLGAVAGVAAGAIGFFGEWPWINAVMRNEWTEALLPEGPLVAAVAGGAMGTIGALLGLGLRRELPAPPRLAGTLAAASLAVVTGCFAFGLADRDLKGVSAEVTLAEAKPPPEREVIATVRFDPPQVADGASWVRDIAWQGGGLVGSQMEEIGPGVYRSRQPLPVHGEWKSAIRVHNGHSLLGLGIYAPADPAIPAPEVPAPATFTREMISPDRILLQRERKDDVPGWLWTGASLSVFVFTLAFLTLLAWGLGRYARGPRQRPPAPPEPRRTGAPAAVPGARA